VLGGVQKCLRELDELIARYPPPNHFYVVAEHGDHVHVSHICGYSGQTCSCSFLFEEHFGASTEDVDFVGFLEASTSQQQITEAYCDTYLRAADASTALEASEKMEDYLIDINIYRLVLWNYVKKLRMNYINRNKILYNKIVGFEMIKKTKTQLTMRADGIQILDMKNSEHLNQFATVMHITMDDAYYFFNVCQASYRTINIALYTNMDIIIYEI